LTPKKKVTFAGNDTTVLLNDISLKRKINLRSTPTKTILKGKHDEDYSLLNMLAGSSLLDKELNISDYDFEIYESDDETCKKIAMQKLNFLIDEQESSIHALNRSKEAGNKLKTSGSKPIGVVKTVSKPISVAINKPKTVAKTALYKAVPKPNVSSGVKKVEKSMCKKFVQNPLMFYTDPPSDSELKIINPNLSNTVTEKSTKNVNKVKYVKIPKVLNKSNSSSKK
jgi:hypothetical protein